jgi:O-acetyl-ADP-ribose deacetylase (regulator of RNase III)
MPLQIIQSDICLMETDAIVNAANEYLRIGGGVCGSIFYNAGAFKLQSACDEYGHCDIGNSVITDSFNLKSKYIIHTVGPIYKDGRHDEGELLESAYLSALELAKDNNCKSISFPLISTGTYAYPKDQALKIAINSIAKFLKVNEMDVYLVYLNIKDIQLSKSVLVKIQKYFDKNISEIKKELEFKEPDDLNVSTDNVVQLGSEESFIELLNKIKNQKNFNDKQLSFNSNINQGILLKILSDKENIPTKYKIISLSIGLQLSRNEIDILLKKVGYSLDKKDRFDVIISYFIDIGIYDINEINITLLYFEHKTL